MRTLIALSAVLVICSPMRAEVLTGVVFNDEGKPAAGASIHAAALFHSPPLRKNAVANQQGVFEIDLAALGGRYVLAVRWQRQGADLNKALDEIGQSVEIKGQQLPPLVIRLRQGGQLRGKLLRAEDDGPIAGAKLFLDTGELLTSDENGAFEVNGLPMKDHSLIPAAAGRLRQYVLFDTTLRPESELEIRLARGAVIRGHVVDEHGRPIPGAYLTRASSGNALTLNGWDEACKPDGTFEYGGLSAEKLFYNLQARAPGYGEGPISAEIDDPTAVIEETIRLKKIHAPAPHDEKTLTAKATDQRRAAQLSLRTISGTVTDIDGRKLSGARVRWGTFLWDASAKEATTDELGNYLLPSVPGAKGAVLVIADAHAPKFAPLDEQKTHLDVVLSPGSSVHGVVHGMSGAPVAGALVILVTACQEAGYCNPIWLKERSTHSDDQGRFTIAAVPEVGATYDVLKDGYSEKRNLVLKTGAADNDVQLPIGGAVRGRIVDGRGRPVRNFKVRAMIPRVREPREPVGGYYAGFDWYGVTYTSADGVFVLTDIAADRWLRLIVSSPGIGRAVLDRVKSEPLDALPAPDKLSIELKPYSRLTVRVFEAGSEKPLVGAHVSLLEDEPEFSAGFNWGYHDLTSVRRHTSDDGAARFDTPACEDGTLIVRATGMARKRLAWTDGAPEIRVSLDPAAALQGEVQFGQQRLGEGYARLVSAAKDFYSVGLAASEGRFEFNQLPAGNYTLSIIGKGNQQLDSRMLKLDAGKAQTEIILVSPSEKKSN
jgi:protocatechuate 3,4-dioxygenase beta subunit